MRIDFVLYDKEEKTYPAYVTKHNPNPEKTFLMIPDGEDKSQKTMALSCSKKTIGIIKRNNVYTLLWLSLFKLPPFL